MQEQNTQDLTERHFTEDEHALSKLIHDFALGLISSYKVEDVKKMVFSGQIPNLRIYKKLVPYNLRQKIYQKWLENKSKIDDFLTYEELLFQTKDHRPDLVDIVSLPEAKRWFEILIKFVGKVIIEDFENVNL